MAAVILESGAGEYTKDRSRFIGEAHAVHSGQEARARIDEAKKRYPDARHHCSAWIIGEKEQRYSDDGEPQGTAGRPILTELTARGLTDAVVIVTRYFGGKLLGTGGLTRAYGAAAKAALDDAVLAEQYDGVLYSFCYPYSDDGRMKNLLQSGGIVLATEYAENVHVQAVFRQEDSSRFLKAVTEAFAGRIAPEERTVSFCIGEDGHAVIL